MTMALRTLMWFENTTFEKPATIKLRKSIELRNQGASNSLSFSHSAKTLIAKE